MRAEERLQNSRRTLDRQFFPRAEFYLRRLGGRIRVEIDDIPDSGDESADGFFRADLDNFIFGLLADVSIAFFYQGEGRRLAGQHCPAERQ